MPGAILTVTLAQTSLSLDLEVPTDVPAADLGPLLVQALMPEVAQAARAVQLTVHPPGRLLEPQETLADAGVWDGGWILIES